MTIRRRLLVVLRWITDPRVAIAVGALLVVGSAVATILTWPPSQTTLRPLIVGILLLLRGIVVPPVRRWLRRHTSPGARRRRRPPQARVGDSSSVTPTPEDGPGAAIRNNGNAPPRE